jgi:hypothetical protein
MGKFTITNGNVYGVVTGVSNTTYIELNEPSYDQLGVIDGVDNQHIWFDTHSQDFKDFVKTINEINDYVNG